jgi:deoxyribodipyrimidine photo-lyase
LRQRLHIVWFKRDLRAKDHAALALAAERASEDGGAVLPLYVVEPELWAEPDYAGRHYAFLRECLDDLRQELARLGQQLVIRTGPVVEILASLKDRHGIAALYSHEETGNGWTFRRDREVAAWCRMKGVPWHELRQNGVIRGLRQRDGWARRWEAFMRRAQQPAPSALRPLPEIAPGHLPSACDLGLADDPCPQRQPGGRAAAIERLDSFLEERGAGYRAAMASPLAGFDACSRISPHLALGTLSTREVAHALARRQAQRPAGSGEARGWAGSLRSFSARLHWRCHFMQKLESEPAIEHRNLHMAYDGLRPQEPDAVRLAAWARGETGLPFVDATMRALIATGWMNFRMRAMLMAVASYHLWLDWRAPGEILARRFTDYEPGIHWPQVQMQSGTTGINTVRIYNPVKQGYDQDPQGSFIRRWLPELADVPDRFVHEPWRWEGAARLLGRAYPEPVVDHLAAARLARERVWAIRREQGFAGDAAQIQDRHGSRKSGMAQIGHKSAGTRRSRDTSKPDASVGAQRAFVFDFPPQGEGAG